jgi:hypothetical protein
MKTEHSVHPDFVRSAGFTECDSKDVLTVNSSVLIIYALQGICFYSEMESSLPEAISFGENCMVTVSQSINQSARLLIGDDLVDDEEKFLEGRGVTYPFVVMYFKEASSTSRRK